MVDDDFKARTKQEILDNFEKNLNAEKNGELYLTVWKELEKIDVKYDELAKMKKQLKLKKQEKVEIEKEIKGSKLDGVDETTLKLQMAEIKKLNKRFETINPEIKELEKNIKDRESELKDIEETYGEKIITSWTNAHSADLDKDFGWNMWKSLWQGDVQWKPSTLKEYHEQTVQDLWNKDRTRWKIFEILEEWVWIDDKLKDKIEKEISDRFFEYYDEKQWSLRMKSARFAKNKLRNKEKIVENIMNLSNERKERKITEFERLEKVYSGKESNLRELINLRGFSEENGFKLVEDRKVLNISWKPVFMVEDSDWYYRVYRWDTLCWHWYKEIWEIQDIWGKPFLKAKDINWDYDVYRWDELIVSGVSKIWNSIEMWWKPAFWINKNWYYRVYRWNEYCWKYDFEHFSNYHEYFKEIWEIQNIWGKPVFWAKYKDWYYVVYRWNEHCWKRCKEIWEIQNIWWKLVFMAKDDGWNWYNVKWYKSSKIKRKNS